MRTWNIRLNLDELNALAAMLFTDYDRAQAFQGLILGCNAGSIPEDTSKSLRSGFTVGSKWRAEAEQFREKQRLGGESSTENRRKKYGTAKPTPKLLQENDEVTSTISRTNPQSTIHKDSTPLPPKSRKRRTKKDIILEFTEGTREVINSLIDEWPTEQPGGRGPIRNDVALAGDRVDSLLAEHDSLSPEILIRAARLYLGQEKYAYKAMQFFFGPGGNGEDPAWRGYAKLAYREAQKVANG